MLYELPLVIDDTEVEQALDITVYYFERKYGGLPHGIVEGATRMTYELFRKGIRQPLVLANRTITALEAEGIKPKAA
jgi:hypothetical protein